MRKKEEEAGTHIGERERERPQRLLCHAVKKVKAEYIFIGNNPSIVCTLSRRLDKDAGECVASANGAAAAAERDLTVCTRQRRGPVPVKHESFLFGLAICN